MFCVLLHTCIFIFIFRIKYIIYIFYTQLFKYCLQYVWQHNYWDIQYLFEVQHTHTHTHTHTFKHGPHGIICSWICSFISFWKYLSTKYHLSNFEANYSRDLGHEITVFLGWKLGVSVLRWNGFLSVVLHIILSYMPDDRSGEGFARWPLAGACASDALLWLLPPAVMKLWASCGYIGLYALCKKIIINVSYIVLWTGLDNIC